MFLINFKKLKFSELHFKKPSLAVNENSHAKFFCGYNLEFISNLSLDKCNTSKLFQNVHYFLPWYNATPCLRKLIPWDYFLWWACILITWISLQNITSIIVCILWLFKCKKRIQCYKHSNLKIAKTLQSYQWFRISITKSQYKL